MADRHPLTFRQRQSRARGRHVHSLFSNQKKIPEEHVPRESFEFFVGLLGLEPRTTEPKSAVLPITP